MIVLGFLITFLVFAVTTLSVYFKQSYQYFADRNFPYLKPRILFGNLTRQILGLESIGISLEKLYNEMKQKGWKYGGYFTFCVPIVLITDLDLLKRVLLEDFEYFSDTSSSTHEDDPLYTQLTNLSGTKWHSIRSKVTQVFSTGNVRNMFESVVQSPGVPILHKRITSAIDRKEPIDIKNILACFLTDAMASCVFGLDCSYQEGEESPFRIYGKKATGTTKNQRLLRTLIQIFPKLGKYFQLSSSNQEADAFFLDTVYEAVRLREADKTLQQRRDTLQILVDLKNNNVLTLNDVAAQCVGIFIGGFESTSLLTAFVLYELSKNQDIQTKVQNELQTVLKQYDQNLTYEGLQDMVYMNQVIDGKGIIYRYINLKLVFKSIGCF